MAVVRRLAFLTLYYPPDLSACAFRSAALVRALRAADPALQIDLFTSMPNRYQSYASVAEPLVEEGGVTVRRIQMAPHRSDMRTQALAYWDFARAATRLIVNGGAGRYDLIFATSSRLMTAALGSWVSRRTGVPLYLDVRDLFVDTMADLLPPHTNTLLTPALSMIERLTMGRATHINLVSPGFRAYFERRYPRAPLTFFTNGIDEEFLLEGDSSPPTPASHTTVLYAGNIGQGQGLHAIIPELAVGLGPTVRFRVIGDGGRREALVNALQARNVTNVELIPPMSRDQLIVEYRAADVLFLHLHAHDAFTRVLPSKIFEYGAVGKPIWAGVAGVAAAFIQRELHNAAVFPPCDAAAGLQAWQSLDLQPTPRPGFIASYRRSAVAAEMARHILSVMS